LGREGEKEKEGENGKAGEVMLGYEGSSDKVRWPIRKIGKAYS